MFFPALPDVPLTAPVRTSAPGRICLFGDHQDYLGLPVITAPLSLRVNLTSWHHGPPGFRLRLPNLDTRLFIPFDGIPLAYEHSRDYLRAGINVMLRAGFTFSRGIEGEVRGALPMGVGLGSSTALIVAWLTALSELADEPNALSISELVGMAYAAEVLEFGDMGSPLDALTAVRDHVLYSPAGSEGLSADVLNPALSTFIIAESRDRETTLEQQRHVKDSLLAIMDMVGRVNPAFSVASATLTDLAEYKDQFSKTDYQLLKTTLANRDLTAEAMTLLHSAHLNHARLGQLFTQQHTYLRDVLQLSTPKLDRLLDVALRAGALGGKVNASGGGGSLFVYAPNAPEFVVEAIDRAGGKATLVEV